MKNLHQDYVQSLLFKVLMDDCDEMITIKSLDLKYLDCNNAFVRHIGAKSKADIIGKPIIEVIPQSDYRAIKENIDKVLETKSLQSYCFDMETDNTLRKIHQTSAPVVQNNQTKYILAISRDITLDELLREELAAKTLQLNTLLENVPLLVYMKDKDLNYITGSKYAKDFVENGIDPYAGDIHINIQDALHAILEEDNFVIENKANLRREKPCWDYDGNQHWYRVVKAPILNEDESVSGLVTIAKNIDSDKEIENQKDLFIATLVHDLKNPLLAQISGLELLAGGYYNKLTDEQREMLTIIIESANYMKDMLYTLINTYKYENGNIKLKKRSTDIDNLIKTCIKENESLAKENKITISFNSLLSKQDKYIVADEKQIRRVITNLLNNGINYAYKDTEFLIETCKKEDKVIIKLTNFGPQMDAETKEHLFEKYISGSAKYQKVGFGLGMYLSKKVLEAHSGHIYYEDANSANTFIIELPTQANHDVEHIEW